MIVGVTKTSRLRLIRAFSVPANKYPRTGISPSTGTLLRALVCFILKQSADRKCIAALDQDVGVECARIDDRTGDRSASKDEAGIAHFIADLRLHRQGDEVVLIHGRPNDKVVAEILVLESTEDRGRGLFVEVQLRHRLVAGDFDFGLLIVSRNHPRIRQEFRIRIFIQQSQREPTIAALSGWRTDRAASLPRLPRSCCCPDCPERNRCCGGLRTWHGGAACGAPIAEVCAIGRTADDAGPVDPVSLFRVRRHFHQPRFDHDLLGRLVDLHQKLADVIDVAAGLAKEKGIGALVDLGRILAGELRREQRRGIFGARIAELIAVALGRLGGPLRRRS